LLWTAAAEPLSATSATVNEITAELEAPPASVKVTVAASGTDERLTDSLSRVSVCEGLERARPSHGMFKGTVANFSDANGGTAGE
jgi:hypothetical protein